MKRFYKLSGVVLGLALLMTGAGIALADDETYRPGTELQLDSYMGQIGDAVCKNRPIETAILADIARAAQNIEKAKSNQYADFTVTLTIDKQLVVTCSEGPEVVLNLFSGHVRDRE
jgi:hypothetical protein